ncbi:MAG: FAD:protein FMN transferase [Bacteriovoracaceae bacterium]|nr:FAD:protein FMN transferase [Bacteriovoracaceae bacterium]
MSSTKCKETIKAMGGEFQWSCFPQTYLSKKDVELIFDQARAEVKRIEDKFTDFKPSYFNRINEMAGISPVQVDLETITLIKKAREFSDFSDGIFDISFASVGHLWRQAKDKGNILDKEIIKSQLKFINYKEVIIDEEKLTVFLPFVQMRIGLGGIGKGYAVDRVYDLFLKQGLTNFMVNGAGDIRVHSRADAPRQWRVSVRNPLSKDPSKSVGVIQLSDGAIASSGGYIHNVKGDQFNHHIIHPKTGVSAPSVIASTVLAENAIVADVTATILMNLSGLDSVKYLDKMNLNGFVYEADGKCYLSKKSLMNFGMPLEVRA